MRYVLSVGYGILVEAGHLQGLKGMKKWQIKFHLDSGSRLSFFFFLNRFVCLFKERVRMSVCMEEGQRETKRQDHNLR